MTLGVNKVAQKRALKMGESIIAALPVSILPGTALKVILAETNTAS
jgi:hypothetical protein